MKANRLFCLILAFMFLTGACRKKPTATTTPIHQAARAGNIQQIQALVSSGSNVNAENRWGETPLHKAAEEGHKDVVELLITKGSNINAKTSRRGETPLHEAALNVLTFAQRTASTIRPYTTRLEMAMRLDRAIRM